MSRLLVSLVSLLALAVLPSLASGQTATPEQTVEACQSATATPVAGMAPAETATPTKADGSPTVTGSPTGTPETDASCAVAILDNTFEEKVIKVAVGTTVTWTNESTSPSSSHTVTADEAGPDGNPIFDSGSDFEEPEEFLTSGESFSHTFAEAGEFPYHCVLHGGPGGIGMAGTVIVE